jgi:hypothetical protein
MVALGAFDGFALGASFFTAIFTSITYRFLSA